MRLPVGLLACGPRRLNSRAGRCAGDGPEAGQCRADWVGGVRQAKGGSRPGLRWLGGFWAERDGSGRCRVNGPVVLGRLGGLGLVSRFRSS